MVTIQINMVTIQINMVAIQINMGTIQINMVTIQINMVTIQINMVTIQINMVIIEVSSANSGFAEGRRPGAIRRPNTVGSDGPETLFETIRDRSRQRLRRPRLNGHVFLYVACLLAWYHERSLCGPGGYRELAAEREPLCTVHKK